MEKDEFYLKKAEEQSRYNKISKKYTHSLSAKPGLAAAKAA